MHKKLEDIDVIILCGGLGKRLRPVTRDQPKVLANIGGKAFLDILIDSLLQYGFKHLILSVGYLKEQIIAHFNNYNPGCKIEFSEEEMPLGTGGAIRRTQPLIEADTFLVMNGDSICEADLSKFYDSHIKHRAILSMVLTKSQQVHDYGIIEMDDYYRIKSFKEKVGHKDNSFINAGIYLMKKDIFSSMPDNEVFSLEYDFFPKILDNNKCYGFVCEGELIDIGTPERYAKANQLFCKVSREE